MSSEENTNVQPSAPSPAPAAQVERRGPRPGEPGFVDRRRADRGKGRRLALYVGVTAVLSLGLGRFWGISSVAQVIIEQVTGEPERVEVDAPMEVLAVHPRQGGLPRKIVQTGTIEAIETAELHPRVSGYIKSVAFDIGEFIDKGQVVATIDADELLKEVDKQAALVELAESRVLQAEAKYKTTVADRDAARGAIKRAVSDINRAEAKLTLHERELARIRILVEQRSIETKLADEKDFAVQAARANLDNAIAAKAVTEAELVSIESGIERAQADVAAARADVRVANAELSKSKVMASYLEMTSPFSGVVTARNYDRGDYIQAASSGGEKSLLTIARNDRMRAVLQVPAPDVPYVKPGQVAFVSVSSLGGKTFNGTISRVARHQDVRTRTMRVEVDLPNPRLELAGGMYGAVAVEVPAPTNELSLPKNCLVGRALNGNAKVFRWINGHLELCAIGVGREYGKRIEVLEGLGSDDWIVTNDTHDFAAIRDGRLATLAKSVATDSKSSKQASVKMDPANGSLIAVQE